MYRIALKGVTHDGDSRHWLAPSGVLISSLTSPELLCFQRQAQSRKGRMHSSLKPIILPISDRWDSLFGIRAIPFFTGFVIFAPPIQLR